MSSSSRRFQRNALLLWSGQFISAMGDSVFMICVGWLAGRVTESHAPVGIAIFLATVPYLIFGPLAGAWVDRGDRRRIMMASDLARAALLLLAPWLITASGEISYVALAGVAFLLGVFATPFEPARDALLPRLLEGRALIRWNAAFQTSTFVARIVGLGLGGVLLTIGERQEQAGLLIILQLDGLTFLASALCLFFIVVPGNRPRSDERHGSLFRDAIEGLRRISRNRLLRQLFALTVVDNFAIMGPAFVGATLLIQRVYGLEADRLAWFEGSMAAGILVGALFIARFGGGWSSGRMILVGMVFDGLTYLPFVWVREYSVALLLIAVHGFFIPFILVGRTSLLQRTVPEGERGKVFAVVALTVSGTLALSALASGWIADLTSPTLLFGLAGTVGAACGVYGLVLLPELRTQR